jgi:hypothetical protein
VTATERPPTCDRCGAIVTLTGYRYTKTEGRTKRELILCPAHQRDHDEALTRQGWVCELLDPPPAEPVGDKIAGTCKTCNGPQFHRFVKATPDAPAVKITQCKACDSRTCGTVFRNGWGVAVKCDSKAFTGDAERCPNGHNLLGES